MNYRAAGRLTSAGEDIVAGAIGWATATTGIPVNAAPVVDAGNDMTVFSIGSIDVQLDGFVRDDGRPVPPGITTSLWTSTDAGVVFADSSDPTTMVTLPGPGTYVLKLEADDSELTSDATVTITVAVPTNTAPKVEAGDPQSIVLPDSVTLTAIIDDDGLPIPASLTINWTQFSGPVGGATILNPTGSTTDISFSEAGQYVFEVAVDDGELVGTSRVTINVDADVPDGVNIAFVASRMGPLPSGDRPLHDRLVAGGATVTVVDDDALLTDYSEFDLIFISTSVVYAKVLDHFADVTVPVVTTEQYLLDDMSMGAPRIGAVAETTTIKIESPGNELAASNTGTVTIQTTANRLGYAEPGVDAMLIATSAGKAVYFAYESGGEMVDGAVAPARRVFFPGTFNTPKTGTSAYFEMLDAAIAFALGADVGL